MKYLNRFGRIQSFDTMKYTAMYKIRMLPLNVNVCESICGVSSTVALLIFLAATTTESCCIFSLVGTPSAWNRTRLTKFFAFRTLHPTDISPHF